MSRLVAVTALGLALIAAVPPTAAAGTTISTTQLFQPKRQTAGCGATNPIVSRKEVLCSAKGIPRPAHSSPSVGDPFVELTATGKPQLVLISQDSFIPGSKVKTLAQGSLWSSRGVTCSVGSSTILCFNADNHGFLIGNGHYTSF
jgi:hypothetical protein